MFSMSQPVTQASSSTTPPACVSELARGLYSPCARAEACARANPPLELLLEGSEPPPGGGVCGGWEGWWLPVAAYPVIPLSRAQLRIWH